MRRVTASRWETLERWSPRLFLVAGMCLLVAAALSGIAFLGYGPLLEDWLVVLELGRLAALTATLGLSTQLRRHDPRLGKLGRAVAALAIALIAILTFSALLKSVGVVSASIPLLGITAYSLSVGTFLLYGLGILHSGSHPPLVGRLLLVNVAALVVVFFGRALLPPGFLAVFVPGGQVLIYVSIARRLRGQSLPAHQPTPRSDTSS